MTPQELAVRHMPERDITNHDWAYMDRIQAGAEWVRDGLRLLIYPKGGWGYEKEITR